VLTSSRKVDECKPLDGGAIGTCNIPLIVSDVVASLAVIDEFNGQIDALENLTAHVDLTSQISSGSFTYGGNRQGMMDVARHVIGCRLTPEPRVQNAFDDVASTIHRLLGSNALS